MRGANCAGPRPLLMASKMPLVACSFTPSTLDLVTHTYSTREIHVGTNAKVPLHQTQEDAHSSGRVVQKDAKQIVKRKVGL
jgi:hypothetical protein